MKVKAVGSERLSDVFKRFLPLGLMRFRCGFETDSLLRRIEPGANWG